MPPQINNSSPNEHWTLQWTQPVEEIKSVAHMFLHEQSGAPLLYLASEDGNVRTWTLP